jgi:surface antigen
MSSIAQKSKTKTLVAIAFSGPLALAAAGCATQAGTGALVGGAAGAILCSGFGSGNAQIVAIVGCSAIGAWLGGVIGAQLDEADRQRALEAQAMALNNPQPTTVQWQGSSNYSGTVQTEPAYTQGGQVCKPYTHTIYIQGQPEVARGTACQNNDGTWTPV